MDLNELRTLLEQRVSKSLAQRVLERAECKDERYDASGVEQLCPKLERELRTFISKRELTLLMTDIRKRVAGGATTNLYDELLTVLSHYGSSVVARATLDKALHAINKPPGQVSTSDVERVVEHAMAGYRMFCPEDRLPGLMLELSEVVLRAV